MEIDDYLLCFSGKEHHERANSGVGVLVHKKYVSNIEAIHYINHRIIQVSLKFNNDMVHIISVYAPDITKPRDDREEFYDKLEEVITNINRLDKIFIIGDTNARVGNTPIPGVMQHWNEDTVNENGEILINMCTQLELRINNTYFQHKPQHKYTFENTRAQRSVIDYIITNRTVHPSKILDVRTLTSANAGTEHNLILCKYRYKAKRNKKQARPAVYKYNVESLTTESTRVLFAQRLQAKLQENNIKDDDDSNEAWAKLQHNIQKSAEEALGIRKCSASNSSKYKPWFNEELKNLTNEKQQAFKKYRNNRTTEEMAAYRIVRNRINTKIRAIKSEYWERFSSEMEHDLYGAQRKIWKLLRKYKKPIDEAVQTTNITPESWTTYFKALYETNNTLQEDPTYPTGVMSPNGTLNEDCTITEEDVTLNIGKLKNRKAPGPDNISNEMIKSGGLELKGNLTALFTKILDTAQIPEDWKHTITIPLHKKGSRKDPNNYRGISLINSVAKLFTKIISTKITTNACINEEQQGFRANRSTIDAIFILRQIVEKSIEYAKPVFMCFVDLSKAFDMIRIRDVILTLQRRGIADNIIQIIKNLNTNNLTQIKTELGTTHKIPVADGIRQGDSLSPTLFNLVMDEVIQTIKNLNIGYSMGGRTTNIICYADDAVLLADNEDDLQRLLYKFSLSTTEYNLQISAEKTKCMVISKMPIRCKLQSANKVIEQVNTFNYLGIDITDSKRLKDEVRRSTNKAAQISGALHNIIWRNKYMSPHSKVRIYKTCVRPILTYGAETRAETNPTKQLMRTTEMKTLRAISGVTLRDRKRSKEIRESLNVQDVVRWTRARRRGWDEHVDRMGPERLAKWAKVAKPNAIRPMGRPPKRWNESWSSRSQETRDA